MSTNDYNFIIYTHIQNFLQVIMKPKKTAKIITLQKVDIPSKK